MRYGRLFDQSLRTTVLRKIGRGNGEYVPTHQRALENLVKFGLCKSAQEAANELQQMTGSQILELSKLRAEDFAEAGHAIASRGVF